MKPIRLGAILLALLLFGCGDSPGRLHIVESQEIPEDIYASATPDSLPATPIVVRVFFVRDNRVEDFDRTVVSTDAMQGGLTALLVGPSDQDLANGITTAIPIGTQLLSLNLKDGIASVDFSSEFEAGAEQSVRILQLAQVVYTLTARGLVTAVVFRIEGEPVSVVTSGGEVVDTPVGRSDYFLAPSQPSPSVVP